jgi:SprT-like family
VISWLTRRFSRDPVQLGLFEAAPAPDVSRHRGDQPTERHLPPPAAQQPAADRCAEQDAAHRTTLPDGEARREVSVPAATRADAAKSHADPGAFLGVLRGRGLRGVEQVRFTRNRRTMVSLAGRVLRVHEGFVHAPAPVLDAIAVFATTRNRARRAAARDVIVEFPVPIRPPTRRPPAAHAGDMPLAARLTYLHHQLNQRHFGAALAPLDIQVSRRLARRLGHYTPKSLTGLQTGEIVISQRHIRRDGWSEAEHTLLHEMVHQWQDETGRRLDHGSGFRAKCRAVGIEPAASRMIHRVSPAGGGR